MESGDDLADPEDPGLDAAEDTRPLPARPAVDHSPRPIAQRRARQHEVLGLMKLWQPPRRIIETICAKFHVSPATAWRDYCLVKRLWRIEDAKEAVLVRQALVRRVQDLANIARQRQDIDAELRVLQFGARLLGVDRGEAAVTVNANTTVLAGGDAGILRGRFADWVEMMKAREAALTALPAETVSDVVPTAPAPAKALGHRGDVR